MLINFKERTGFDRLNQKNIEKMSDTIKISIIALAGIMLSVFLLAESSEAQTSDIELEVQVDPVFSSAQVISLTNLVFDESGGGTRLFTIFIQNRSDVVQESLYLDLLVRSRKDGLIAESFQRTSTPFSLNPGQTVFASNNDLARGRVTGLDTELGFDGGITSSGTEMMNRLQGRTTLPVDEYELEIRLYQNNNRPSGGDFVTNATALIGGDMVEDELSLFLLAPGDAVGTGMMITNPYPEFRWEGQQEREYRLIVVEERDGESPETLIQGAKSTSAGSPGSPTSLLEYEMVDVTVQGTNLQYPSTGVQQLEEGKTYYWQVFTSLSSTSGREERASEIYSFSLGSGFSDDVEVVGIDGELRDILIALLGLEIYLELEQRDFELEGLEIDDEEMHGGMARDELIQLAEKIRDGKIKISR
jgi:hypothetical protein